MIVCMAAGTVLFLIFAGLILTADSRTFRAMLQCLKEQELEKAVNAQIQLRQTALDMKKKNDFKNKKQIRKAKAVKKSMDAAKKQAQAYQNGKINPLDMIPLAGYRLIQLLKWDYSSTMIKELNKKCIQFKEKKEAMNYTYYLLASLFGYMQLAFCAFFVLLGTGLAFELKSRSVLMAAAGFVIFALLGYVPYDNVNAVVKKREREIERQFPQAVSKMSLLTVAGLEVNQAWRLACQGGKGTLYEEMVRVLVDFDNNVPPAAAYTKFITRCNNKYTTKLATAILQNLSKGNAEIVKLFRELNDESWMEHKHSARRMGEQIQSKLLVPTLLMFLGIIILVIVPVMSGFNIM